MPSTVNHWCLCLFTVIIPPPTSRLLGYTNYLCIASHKEQLDPWAARVSQELQKEKKTDVRVLPCIAQAGNWRAGLSSWKLNECNEGGGSTFQRAILAQALGARRKSTTAVAKEVPCLLNSSLDSCWSERRRRGKEGTIMVITTAVFNALSFHHFISLQSHSDLLL